MKKIEASFALVLVSSGSLLGCGDAPDEIVSGVAGALTFQPTIAVARETPVLHQYEDAPRTPDGDDPAIWVHPRDPGRSLFVGALKNAGMQVYDLAGRVVQSIPAPSRPAVTPADPPVPGGPALGTGACPDSASGETFGRFNNVDIMYGFDLDVRGRRDKQKTDIAVVTDRGCDRVRIFSIDPGQPGGPLREITSPRAGRLFPNRLVQPSPFQPGDEPAGVHPNPLDDQSTGYGLALYDPPGDRLPRVFVTQRSRTVVAEFLLLAEGDGTVNSRKIREYRFPAIFKLREGSTTVDWTPCREDANDDPQLEGMVVDQERGILYASQEVIGVWRIELDPGLPAVVNVTPDHLLHRTTSFGLPYWAIPDDGEFSCETPEGTPPADAIVVPGVSNAAGRELVADVEGLAIYHTKNRGGYLLVSSQGDGSYHVYDRRNPRRHLGTFRVEGTDETDGHEVVNVPLGRAFPHGLFVTQNGAAPPPASEDPINGFEYDGSTRFELVDWRAIAAPLGLDIDTDSFDPRDLVERARH